MPVETPRTPRFSRALEEELRERATTRRRRRMPSLRPLIALAAVAAAFAFVLLPNADETGEESSRPLAAEPKPTETFVLERPSRKHPQMTFRVDDLLRSDRARLERLRPEFRKRGALLAIRERPVKRRSADGQVFTVSSRLAHLTTRKGDRTVVDEKLGVVTVTIGRVPEKIPPKSGKTVTEAFPEVCELIVEADPTGSLRRLREAGFEVLTVPTDWNTPGVAPKVFAVRDGENRVKDADPTKRSLVLVVGPPGEGHTGGVACAR